jgi:hypothetical protein
MIAQSCNRYHEVPIDVSTPTTCLACKLLCCIDHFAPWKLTCFVVQVHPESVMGPSTHRSRCLWIQLSLFVFSLGDHLLCIKHRNQHHAKVATQPLCCFAMKLIHDVTDLCMDPKWRPRIYIQSHTGACRTTNNYLNDHGLSEVGISTSGSGRTSARWWRWRMLRLQLFGLCWWRRHVL